MTGEILRLYLPKYLLGYSTEITHKNDQGFESQPFLPFYLVTSIITVNIFLQNCNGPSIQFSDPLWRTSMMLRLSSVAILVSEILDLVSPNDFGMT